VKAADCPDLADPRRTLLGAVQERWLAEGWSLHQRWNLLAQQTLMARCSWTDPARGATFWTDGWDGYAASRQRVLGAVADRRVSGVVVMGGDVHANYVADLKLDFSDEGAPVLATEFCGTSISSLGTPQDRLDRARGFNPHLHWARSDQRGYVRLSVTPADLQAALRVVADAREVDSPVSTAARYAVDPLRAGAVVA